MFVWGRDEAFESRCVKREATQVKRNPRDQHIYGMETVGGDRRGTLEKLCFPSSVLSLSDHYLVIQARNPGIIFDVTFSHIPSKPNLVNSTSLIFLVPISVFHPLTILVHLT